MKFKIYLNEKNNSIENVVKTLKKNCKKFIKEIKFSKNFLFRGHKSFNELMIEKKRRKDRKPKDLDIDTSKYFDVLFNKKFGWNVRSSGIFTTFDINTSEDYGNPYLFFPIGNYKYVYSYDVEDLYSLIDDDLYGINYNWKWEYEKNKYKDCTENGITYNEFKKEKKSELEKMFKNLVNGYTDKNIYKMKNKINEITFDCDYYYLVDLELIEILTKEFL